MSENKEIKTKKIIDNHDSGFIKPAFNFFDNDEEIIEEAAPIIQEKLVETFIEEKQTIKEETIEETIEETEEIVEESFENLYQNNDDEFEYNTNENTSYEETIENEIVNTKFEEDLASYKYEEESFLLEQETEEIAEESFEVEQKETPIIQQPNFYSEPKIELERKIETHEVVFENESIRMSPPKGRNYNAPSPNLLKEIKEDPLVNEDNKNLNNQRLNEINEIFVQLKVGAKATGYTIGPSVTRFDILPNKDVSVSMIDKYIDDISSRLGGVLARFEKIVQGRTSSALEIPNQKSMMVGYKDCFLSLPPKKPGADLFIPFGKSIDGTNIGADLTKFPHLLVSGSTGSGKSVYINSLIVTMIMRNSPDDLKLLIIDPKEVESARYNGIPHLLGPIISQTNRVKTALERLAEEMDARYSFLRDHEAIDIKDYNEEAEEKGLPKLPYIVCIIDEYADLIENDKSISNPVTRLAAKSRACGIHLIIATQRPSTNVITGTIKSNIPVRVAFLASSGVDSRVMLDQNGAETLVGNGDMLVQCQFLSRNSLIRAQGFFLSSLEIKNVLNDLKSKYQPEYDSNFENLDLIDEFSNIKSNEAISYLDKDKGDSLYEKVREFAYAQTYCSLSAIQRTFGVGFNRAGKLFNMLINDGIVSSTEGIPSKGREVIVHSEAEYNDLVLEREEIN